jgi:DNA mismatch repair protein MutS
MAQAGSFVPALEASIGMVDRIYCRVGASDNLARGESTFLVEMNETAHILRTATGRSLVIMDEVGRGTGTKDGLSIAWAVCEELLDHVKCRTLFATHYYELSKISHPRMVNRSMEVLDRGGEIIFLRQLKEGPTAESYGLHVARLAGLPERVLDRAAQVMDDMWDRSLLNREPETAAAAGKDGTEPEDRRLHRLVRELKQIDVERISPLEALNCIYVWKGIFASKTPSPKVSPKKKSETSPELPF